MKVYEYFLKAGIPPKYVLANFREAYERIEEIFGTDNIPIYNEYKKIYDLCNKIIKSKELGVYLFGDNGSGKTYTGVAMLREYMMQHCCEVARTTTTEVIKWYTTNYQGMMPRYIAADVLLVEEIAKEVDFNSSQTPKIIEELIKGREERNQITLYTANSPGNHLEEKYQNNETIYRIIQSTTVEIEFPDFDFREYKARSIINQLEKSK